MWMFSLLTFKSRVLGFAALGVIGIAAALPFALSEDGPWVSVGFEQSSYAVAEGDSVTVTVTLDVVPDREVVVPITTTEEGGASGPDYSGARHGELRIGHLQRVRGKHSGGQGEARREPGAAGGDLRHRE